ncbi:MAG: mannitol-1-phosphate 5-dehydrogenase [Helcococcus sp.]|nr:mannitol-1-phosphate 5-dehydrogenase [Helcococcus sp.]
MKKAIQFGAGNIGRGFIGLLLNKAGYDVVFADVFQNVVDEINKEKEYTIYVKDVDLEEIKVEGISAVNSTTDEILDEIAKASIITTAVGPLNLQKLAPALSKGIEKRYKEGSKEFLNIIACENAVYASSTLKDFVYNLLDDDVKAYADKFIGFPNSSVDRIVPPSENPKPLDVTVEKYFEWNVEKDGFKGEKPIIEGMNIADNLLAYIERKLFTLNTGHATTAYIGSYLGYNTIDEAIKNPTIEKLVRNTMRESGDGLIKKFDFDKDAHYAYIEKILKRFKNPYLNDDVKRVGREPIRKLSPQERFIKPLTTAIFFNLPVDNLITGISAALHYQNDEDQQAKDLQDSINLSGVLETVKHVTKLTDEKVLEKIEKAYNSIDELIK